MMQNEHDKHETTTAAGGRLERLASQPGRLVTVTDEVAERLDEMADLAEHWKRHRERGRMPMGIRSGMLMACREAIELLDAGLEHSERDAG